MIYYMIRHKASGEFMPELKRGKGYSWWNPSVAPTNETFSYKKLTGTPRLFVSRRNAHGSIVQWNAVPNSYNGYRSGPFGSDEPELQIKDDGRKKEDLEIVEVEIMETGH